MAMREESWKDKAYTVGGIIAGAVLVTFTALVLYSIVMRYFFSAPPRWGEEVPKILFIWMIFIGAGFADLAGANIRMTVVIDMVPRGPRRIIELIVHLAIVGMLVVLIWYSIPVLELTFNVRSRATGLAEGWKFLAMPLGCILLLINEFYRIWVILRGGVDESGSGGGGYE
ncbi:MAG: TRAP transporter small permease [Rhodobacteraceae bacterium]|nr:TRAP transporter small permease [Paracoccaceae bacterium]